MSGMRTLGYLQGAEALAASGEVVQAQRVRDDLVWTGMLGLMMEKDEAEKMANGPVLQETSFKCPFCGRDVVAQVLEKHDQVLHSMPMCELFEKLDPLDYLIAARKAKLGPMPWDGSEGN